MKCREIEHKIDLYLDGVLGPEEAAAVEEHLAECPDCAMTHKELLQLRKDLSTMEPVKPPADFLRSVNERIDAKDTAGSLGATVTNLMNFFTRRHTLEAAGLLAVAAVVMLVFFPTITMNLPDQKASEEKEIADVDKKAPMNLKSARKPRAEKMAKRDFLYKGAGTSRAANKDMPTEMEKTPPVTLYLTLRERKEVAPSPGVSETVVEEKRRMRKSSPMRLGKSSAKKAMRIEKAEESSRDGYMADSDRNSAQAIVPPKTRESRDRIARIRKIARRYSAVVKEKEVNRVLEVTISGQKVPAFMKELKSLGELSPAPKKYSETRGKARILLNLE